MQRPVIGSKFTFFFGNEGSNTVNYRHEKYGWIDKALQDEPTAKTQKGKRNRFDGDGKADTPASFTLKGWSQTPFTPCCGHRQTVLLSKNNAFDPT